MAVSFNAYSADYNYFGANLGVSTVEERGIDTGVLGSIFWGSAFDEYRIEAELFRQENDINSGPDLDTTGILVNGYFDLTTESEWTPYIGAGAGYAKYEAGSFDDYDFIWQVSAGVSYELNENTFLDFRYRYYNVDAGGGYDGHSGLAGVRIKF